jgi:ketosteroid isomerase-like protein
MLEGGAIDVLCRRVLDARLRGCAEHGWTYDNTDDADHDDSQDDITVTSTTTSATTYNEMTTATITTTRTTMTTTNRAFENRYGMVWKCHCNTE